MYRSYALSLCLIAMVGKPVAAQTKPAFVAQNWAEETRTQFWFIDQGSRLMPLAWFNKLAMDGKPFHENLERYGFIAGGPADALPIGFAVGTEKGDPTQWVGVTCSACHTARIDHNGKSYLIEGAPAMIDFDKFVSDLVTTLDATRDDQQKWNTFANGLPQQGLKDDFASLTKALDVRKKLDTPPAEAGPAGYGRLDAFGHIFNQVIQDIVTNPRGLPQNAPASFPALWDIAQHGYVQWNYSAPNLGVGSNALGSLIRNIGEVLGVFGKLSIEHQGSRWVYSSSAKIDNLKKVEEMLASLRSPAWPFEEAIDDAKKKDGERVYYRLHCDTCHAVIDSQQPPISYPAFPIALSDVLTDPQVARNIEEARAPTGILRGAPKGPLNWRFRLDPFNLTSFGRNESVKLLSEHLALNLLVAKADQISATTAGIIGNVVLGTGLRYKARPLNGIWATAPYLHNGSVPNLYELLKPEKERLAKFCAGDHEFDVKNVGYLTHSEEAKQGCQTGTIVDTSRVGSHNIGHPYPLDRSNFSDKDMWNLIEFLKSL
jgi:hypothetical protein